LKAYLRKYGEEWREDASNADVAIERNNVRKNVIPFLEMNLDSNLVEHIYKITKILQKLGS
jgi:tRNA(Ile)-lysidine synthase TilS/MesJ